MFGGEAMPNGAVKKIAAMAAAAAPGGNCPRARSDSGELANGERCLARALIARERVRIPAVFVRDFRYFCVDKISLMWYNNIATKG